ncbi:MAG: hypothetical protein WCH11_02985 [Bdellovibrio sp.]
MKHILLAAAVLMAGSAFADNHGKKPMAGKKAAAHKEEKKAGGHGDMEAKAPVAPAATPAPEKK